MVNLNIWSFILTLGTITLFFIVSSSASIINFFLTHLHFHPLNILLLLTIGCFFLALIGLKDVKNIATLIISYCTMTITVIFGAILSFILLIWQLLN